MTIQEIKEQLMKDERNASYTLRGIPPIYQIDPAVRVLIISQAPGRKVEESGICFHDASGRLLRIWLGMDENTFYSKKVGIMPMDFYYPGKGKSGDKPPRSFVAREYHQEILELMPEVRLTVLVGRYAMEYYLKGKMKDTLTDTVMHYKEYLPQYFPIVHPSPLNQGWRKRNPWFEAEVVGALQEEVKKALQ